MIESEAMESLTEQIAFGAPGIQEMVVILLIIAILVLGVVFIVIFANKSSRQRTTPPPMHQQHPPTVAPADQRLTELQSLLEKGLITQEDFDTRKADILKSV